MYLCFNIVKVHYCKVFVNHSEKENLRIESRRCWPLFLFKAFDVFLVFLGESFISFSDAFNIQEDQTLSQ
jgi:hypothetical protein